MDGRNFWMGGGGRVTVGCLLRVGVDVVLARADMLLIVSALEMRIVHLYLD
jgi:hypothetical protein